MGGDPLDWRGPELRTLSTANERGLGTELEKTLSVKGMRNIFYNTNLNGSQSPLSSVGSFELETGQDQESPSNLRQKPVTTSATWGINGPADTQQESKSWQAKLSPECFDPNANSFVNHRIYVVGT